MTLGNMLLVKYHDDYSDEFNVDGFRIFTHEQWEHYKSTFPDDRFEFYFGTNELIDYINKEHFLKSFDVVAHVDEKFVENLVEIFGDNILKYGYGVFPYERE